MKSEDYQTPIQAKNYHHKRFSGGLSQVNIDETKLLKSWIPKTSKSLIYLDLGSGTGRVTKVLLTQNPKMVYALDKSPAMIDFFKKKHLKYVKNKKLQLIIADCQKIPLRTNSVDFITAFHLLKHLPDSRPTIEEAARVLKPGGYFMFNCLNKYSLINFNLETCYALSKTAVVSMLKQYAFRVNKLAYLCSFGETVYNLIGKKKTFIIHPLDKLVSTYFRLGTKIFVLARKL